MDGSKAVARLLPILVLIAGPFGTAIAQETHDHLVTQCVDIPPGEKRPEFGCWVVATTHDLTFAEPSIYWHLRKFPSRQAAEDAKTRAGVVGEVQGQVWRSDFGPKDMKVEGGEEVAVIGPLELPQAKTYDAVFMEAAMRPLDRSRVHTHPGPEAWYMLAGEQCLETPAGAQRASAGGTMTVPPNVPMELMIVGTKLRRSLVLVVHDSTQQKSIVSDWKPTGRCLQPASGP
jgi:quercetin dioxygenase-like cupin family protein